MSEVIINIDKVSKVFKLPHQKKDSVKNIFTNIFSLGQQSYETQHALDSIDFNIKRGEFFGIVGRNGSGKSTLLKLIAGIYQPTKGGISIGGRVVPFIELGVGFNGELTGRENVYLNGALLGFSEKEIDAKYQDIVDFAEIERFMDQKLKNYSSGMQVRLAFSVATRLAESDILLIDEVLAVGDADFQRKCFRYFKQLKKEKKTVVFVTHDMNAVREYCDRAAFIEKSKLIAVDHPEEIAKMYEKLLMPKTQGASESEGQDRWGDGVVTIENPRTEKIDKKRITISMDIRTHSDCDDPIFGFVFKNGSGKSLTGSNSLLEKTKTEPLKVGEIKKITWSFDNIFPDGEYLITLGVLYDSGATTADWREDVLRLNVARATHSPYLTAPNIELTIK